MAAVESTMLELGTQAPDFALPDTEGNTVARTDFAGKPLLVMFICNHCPFVKHVNAGLVKLANDYAGKGVGFVAINSNDVANYPDDAPDKMAAVARNLGYPFPYLFDESQEVAKAYDAACTPDFYIFDAHLGCAYRGRLDDSRPGNGLPVTGRDIRAALDALIAGKAVSDDQHPSAGCNIKWKA